MSIREEIIKIWNEQIAPLNEIYEKVIGLLQEALDTNAEIPYEELVDIIVSANTSLGYGNQVEEAKFIFQAMTKLLESDNPSSIPKIHRLACLTIGIILTLITVDEASTKKELNKILKYLNIKPDSTRIGILRSIAHLQEKLIHDLSPSYWSLELVSFVLILTSFLQEYDDLDEKDRNLEEKIFKLASEWDSTENEFDLKQWTERWLETNDFFRFNGLMIFGKAVKKENLLLEKLNRIYPS